MTRAHRLAALSLLALSTALLACGKDSSAGSSAPPVSSGPTPSSSILADAVRAKVCNAAPCGGAQSSIQVYRDDAGTVKRLYRLYGSCSHSPGIYFDPDGSESEAIPEKPVVPGSDEERAFKAKHDAQVGGLKHTDTIGCADGARSAP